MAQILFNFPDDLDAQKILDDFCDSPLVRYERTKLEGETKKQFLRRKTLEWWYDLASQGKAKREINNWRGEYDQINVTE